MLDTSSMIVTIITIIVYFPLELAKQRNRLENLHTISIFSLLDYFRKYRTSYSGLICWEKHINTKRMAIKYILFEHNMFAWKSPVLVFEVGIVNIRIVINGWADFVRTAHRNCRKRNCPDRRNRVVQRYYCWHLREHVY